MRHLRRKYERWYNTFGDSLRKKGAENARKHPMWAGTVTPANIWRVQEEIEHLASEVEALKEKIRKMEEDAK